MNSLGSIVCSNLGIDIIRFAVEQRMITRQYAKDIIIQSNLYTILTYMYQDPETLLELIDQDGIDDIATKVCELHDYAYGNRCKRLLRMISERYPGLIYDVFVYREVTSYNTDSEDDSQTSDEENEM